MMLACFQPMNPTAISLSLTVKEQVRFWARVDKNGPIVRPELGPCWEWGGPRAHPGYGRLHVGWRSSPVLAHRVAYAIAVGPLPDEMKVCHSCDHPPCCNPSHLFLGTTLDNIADKVAKGRQGFGESAPRAILTEPAVIEILVAFATGEFSQRALALEHGVDDETVRDILRGVTWAHVPGPRLPDAEIRAIGKRMQAKIVSAKMTARHAARRLAKGGPKREVA